MIMLECTWCKSWRYIISSCEDVTFKIWNSNIRIITYKPAFFFGNEINTKPVILGSILIYSSKSFHSYFSLPGNLTNLKVFRTDGKKNSLWCTSLIFPWDESLSLYNTYELQGSINLKVKVATTLKKNFWWKVGEVKIKGSINCTS